MIIRCRSLLSVKRGVRGKEEMGQEILQLAAAVSSDKGLEVEDVLDALEGALARVVRHERGANWGVRVEIDRDTGHVVYLRTWEVIAEDDEAEESDSCVFDSNPKAQGRSVGDVIEEPIEALTLGRVAARLARQFLYQGLRETESKMRRQEFADKVGQVVSGSVKRVEMGNYHVEVKRFEAILRKDQIMPGENFTVGMRVRAVVDRIDDSTGHAHIMLSRTSPLFLCRLLEHEVPEVADGSVQVITAARDPGSRAKVVVYSHDPSVDPVGACIGMRGVRIQSITNELNGEKVDVIQWSEDLGKYIINIFSSADVRRVLIDQDSDRIEVVVSDETLSFAIGRAGQNVKLARQLVKKRLEIMGASDAEKRDADELKECVKRLQDALDIDDMLAHLLVLEGCRSLEDFCPENEETIAAIEGLDKDTAAELVSRAQAALQKAESIKQSDLEEKDTVVDLRSALQEMGLEKIVDCLQQGGVNTVEDLAWLSVDELLSLTGDVLDADLAARVIMRLRAPLIQD